MLAIIEIVTGLVLGCIGFFEIPNNPASASSALFVSGLLLIAGVDGLGNKKAASNLEGNSDAE